MDHLKRLEKDHQISEDERKKQEAVVQQATDRHIRDIDAALAAKEEEIVQV
jgi:ribosome recycling factor